MATKDRSRLFGGYGDLLAGLHPRNLALRQQIGLLGIIGLTALPVALFPLQLAPFIGIVFLMIFAMSWDVVSGYTGQLSFGHAFFFAVGGYTSAILNVQHGMHPFVSIPVAMVVTAIAGIVIGLPALRLRGSYLSLVTLIVPLILAKLFILWNDELVLSILGVTIPLVPEGFGGRSGLNSPPQVLFAPSTNAVVTVESFRMQVLTNYYLALGLFVLILAVLLVITRSSTGDIFEAIREDEDTVAAVGLSPTKFKLFAFVLSGVIGGLAGAVFVHSMAGYPQPAAILNLQLSITVIVVTILGGVGTIVGAAVGALFYGVSANFLSGLELTVPILNQSISNLRPVPLMTIAVLIGIYVPNGLVPGSIRAGRQLLARLRGEDHDADSGPTALSQIASKYRKDLQDLTGLRTSEEE